MTFKNLVSTLWNGTRNHAMGALLLKPPGEHKLESMGKEKKRKKPHSWLRKNVRVKRVAVRSWRLVCANMLYEVLKELATMVLKKRNKGNKLGICTKGNYRKYGTTLRLSKTFERQWIVEETMEEFLKFCQNQRFKHCYSELWEWGKRSCM